MRVWLFVPCLFSLSHAFSPESAAQPLAFLDSLPSDPTAIVLSLLTVLILAYQCFKSSPRSQVTVVFKKLDAATLQQLTASVAKQLADVKGQSPPTGPEDALLGVNEAVSTLKKLQYEFQNEIIKAHEQIWQGLSKLPSPHELPRPAAAEPAPAEPDHPPAKEDPAPPAEVLPPPKAEEPKAKPISVETPPVKPEETPTELRKPSSKPASRKMSDEVKSVKPPELSKKPGEEDAKLPPPAPPAPPAQVEEVKRPADVEEVKAPAPSKFIPPVRKPGITRPKFVPPAVVSSPFGAK